MSVRTLGIGAAVALGLLLLLVSFADLLVADGPQSRTTLLGAVGLLAVAALVSIDGRLRSIAENGESHAEPPSRRDEPQPEPSEAPAVEPPVLCASAPLREISAPLTAAQRRALNQAKYTAKKLRCAA